MRSKLGLIPIDFFDGSQRVQGLSKVDSTGWFFRCGTDHHSLVVASQILNDTMEPNRKGDVVNQLSWQIGSLKEVVDAVEFIDKKARLRRVGRDVPGSNYHSYAYDPDGYVNEVYYGLEQVGWDGTSKPQYFNRYGVRAVPEMPQLPEISEVSEAMARGESMEGFRWLDDLPLNYDVDGNMMARPFKVTRLGRVLLPVEDIGVSLSFYVGVLGLRLTERISVNGQECAFLRADDEHHTLVLFSHTLIAELGIVAGYGLTVATYQQLRDAYSYFEREGITLMDLPAALSSGIPYGFWIKGPDNVGIFIYYAMERSSAVRTASAALPCSPAAMPEAINCGAEAWFDPPFLGPLA